MAFELKVPSPGESISEVEIAQWLVSDGDYVEKDQVICEVDSDKATLELPSEASGVIKLIAEEGQTVAVGEVVAEIDTDAEAPAGKSSGGAKKEESAKAPDPMPAKEEKKTEEKKEAPSANQDKSYATGHPSAAAKKLMDENNISSGQISGTGKDGRITKQDVVAAMAAGINAAPVQGWGGSRDQRREKMSMLRRKIAERLVSVKNETAMLTTFNEIDMSPVMELRKKYKDQFREHHDVNLGFMSFFTKAVTEALNHFPAVNAQIDGKEILFHDYADIGIAVSSPKGLMVPILRNAEQMSLADIEKEIKRLAIKARDGKLSVDEMTGGTFTITNGGVFGSMMSTPIINPPQVAILGMHNIVERPVAINGKVEIRPMMYVALSYDHRIIDGKESVGFLVKIKEMIENPVKIVFGGKAPEEILLNL
ncbi:2-oxoglutarate dehydrogenase complex dihydrolipoyllysine-residue succinyltransferase [Luteibaculum oceani]|uniref:Dihydrolipoyllysine-residue succinyltransferase component of 2-oxoglutarate dehydrogenase complex n=1 Tax=Luteibaculum oceani TaxID=1294296 RepID=A0A5C6UZU0_9FLAO|nr:2-oxoglutarate dehydrogenase complex dihydrolipoyllysine-residue succinyltransferase [Luteibaculum oceani]TXC78912.1 2-oxoglutarate dehydrogenase complex dihydrolipoyllysine-residue succinyltransferase [Luteibaculum oceani]